VDAVAGRAEMNRARASNPDPRREKRISRDLLSTFIQPSWYPTATFQSHPEK
jgi:hypothetical protein